MLTLSSVDYDLSSMKRVRGKYVAIKGYHDWKGDVCKFKAMT